MKFPAFAAGMSWSERVDIGVVVAAVGDGLAAAGLGLGYFYYRKARREHEQQQYDALVASQPALVGVGAGLNFGQEFVPQRLRPDANLSVTLENHGKSIASDIQVVLFPNISTLPPDAPPVARTEELGGIYWEGRLDGGMAPGAQMRVDLYPVSFPLHGRLSLISGRTLFGPPAPGQGTISFERRHYYFGRLTITYRYPFNRILATDFDGESVPKHGEPGLEHYWRAGAGPVEVKMDLRELADRAAEDRRPPIYGS